jgi:hypothetical protein
MPYGQAGRLESGMAMRISAAQRSALLVKVECVTSPAAPLA